MNRSGLNLGDGTLLDFRWLGEGQDEWPEAIQLLAPALGLLVTKLGAAIGGVDEPVTEIRIMELDRWKTVDSMDAELNAPPPSLNMTEETSGSLSRLKLGFILFAIDLS